MVIGEDFGGLSAFIKPTHPGTFYKSALSPPKLYLTTRGKERFLPWVFWSGWGKPKRFSWQPVTQVPGTFGIRCEGGLWYYPPHSLTPLTPWGGGDKSKVKGALGMEDLGGGGAGPGTPPDMEGGGWVSRWVGHLLQNGEGRDNFGFADG